MPQVAAYIAMGFLFLILLWGWCGPQLRREWRSSGYSEGKLLFTAIALYGVWTFVYLAAIVAGLTNLS
jgi:hypothetical protein